ncbi:MAG: ADP-ribosylation factor-like protein [Cyanobacteria bacterium P01_G01_bin.67]
MRPIVSILYGNPIEEPPLEVVKQGNQAILNYYSQIAAQGKDYLYEAKMLIVGEGGAGKTTLAHKIQDNNCPLPHIDDRTKGITINTHDFSISTQNGGTRSFILNVWDFGGQEIYHATHRFFLSKRSLYVLVADNREDNTDFNYWLNIIELFAGDSPIIIVLNEKDDLQRTTYSARLINLICEVVILTVLKKYCPLTSKPRKKLIVTNANNASNKLLNS